MGVVKGWEGRFYEDFEIGDVYRSTLGRTISEVDNTWFTNLTLNTNQSHFNAAFAEASPFGKILVNSAFTVALVTGLSVTDVSENAMANLASAMYWNATRAEGVKMAKETASDAGSDSD